MRIDTIRKLLYHSNSHNIAATVLTAVIQFFTLITAPY